ncbi:MAG: response regulator [Limimaricola sp.]|uniref:response regulator n=1 Tax=Limimaricola sp. TaxID=2211665 RepID=UPI001D9D0478|nr:response regulator [Limimaricola sp.]MBI1415844.1 response regulator [Limimaricola sp.]
MDEIDAFLMQRPAPPDRPLFGLTVLTVEDSRFASEAMRLLCQRSGARLRRADSIAAGRRHLGVYRPAVVIVDLGLPDGAGEDLIAEIARAVPRIPALLGTSGDPGGETRALAAGADGFLPKPITSLGSFQATLLAHLPPEMRPLGTQAGPVPARIETIRPDPMAFRDDLRLASDRLRGQPASGTVDYLTQFLGGVARSADDRVLGDAVGRVAARRRTGAALHPALARLSALVEERLARPGPF